MWIHSNIRFEIRRWIFIRRIKKKALFLLMLLGLLCFSCTVVATAETVTAVSAAKTVKKGKWVNTKKGKKYQYGNKKYAKNVWLKVGKYIYRINEKGYMQTGWIEFKGQSYYAGKDGKIYIKRWLTSGKAKYFFQKTGICAKKKWLKISGKYYYFKSNGKMARNQMVTTKNQTFYVNKNGQRILSIWLNKDGKRYYFNKSGVRIENQWVKSGGKFYYLGKDGAMLVNQWVGDYYVGKNGTRMKNCYIDGYYLNEKGKRTIKRIIVGDSRMVGMEQAAGHAESLYIAKVGAGYDWLAATGGELLKDYLNSNQKVTVVLALGVNDMGNLPYYISYYQDLMKKYPKTTFYVMGVGPVDEKTEEKHGYRIKNASIEAFNTEIANTFGRKYLDIYQPLLEKKFEAWDGVHYTVKTYKILHDIVMGLIS